MTIINSFALAFFFSFIGSIPPGTINLTIIQLGLGKKMAIAWRFAMAAAIIEYPYAWLAITFNSYILSSPTVLTNLKLITAVVMITLGLINLLSSNKPSSITQQFENSGFRRGLLLGILNPLNIPYWLGITAYLKAQGWVDLSTSINLHSFLLGVSLGSLSILIVIIYLASQVVSLFQHSDRLKKIPGIVLISLGTYSLIRYFI